MGVRGIEHNFGIVGADATFFDTDFFFPIASAVPQGTALPFTFYVSFLPWSILKTRRQQSARRVRGCRRNTEHPCPPHVLTRSDRFRRVLRHSNTALRDGGRAEQEVANRVE